MDRRQLVGRNANGTKDVGKTPVSTLFSSRELLWQYVASFGVAIFGALFVLAAGRFLGPEEFGIYAVAAAVPTVINALLDFRIQEVSIVVLSEKNNENEYKKNINCLFTLDFISRIFAFAFSVPIGFLVMDALGFVVESTVPALAAFIVLVTKAGSGIALGLMRLSGNIQKYALLQSLDWALRVFCLVMVLSFSAVSIDTVFIVQLPSALAINIWIIYLASKISEQDYGKTKEPFSIQNLIDFFRKRATFLLSSQSISAVDSVVKELDTLICGIFLSAHSIAVYKIAKSVAAVAWKCVDPIFVVILPNIATYGAERRLEELSPILRKATSYLFCVALVVFCGAWLMSYPFTRYILGPEYEDVPAVFPLISVWIIFALPVIWTHSVAMATDNAVLQAKSGFWGAIIGVSALTFGAANSGLPGAALGLSVAFAAPFIISFILLKKKKILTW